MIDTEIYLLACEDIVILYAFDAASPHGLLDVLQESISILGHFRGGFFVQWIVRVRLEEQILQSNHDRIQVKDWLPVLTQNVQANISL